MTTRRIRKRPAAPSSDTILTLNAGSSSLKFALFRAGAATEELSRGQVEGIGSRPRLSARDAAGKTLAVDELDARGVAGHEGALDAILRLVRDIYPSLEITAVGHRVVHGGHKFALPVRLDPTVIDELAALQPLAPLHQPHNVAGILAASAAFPKAVQVACFDTAFHRQQPWVNDTFALPRSFYDEGVRRYGFHGLSYEYVTGELSARAPHHASGRVVIAHLGNGASMCAINGGQSVASSMGFSALDGLPMGTRCGQLDPGVLLYLMGPRGLSAAEIEDLLYRRSGLLGLSGLTHDMRELERAATPEALQAIDYFVFRTRRELGAMTAILSGLDAMVFCGGIGENAWRIRERILDGFGWIGIELDASRNRAGSWTISSDRSRVQVCVVRTNEELMIARHTQRLVGA